MPFTSLSSEDATLLCAETPEAPLQIGALCVFEGGSLRNDSGTLAMAAVKQHLLSRIEQLPRFRQRLLPVPYGLGPPVWVDDETFDIDRHVHAAALPKPGDDQRLRELIGRLLEAPLDPHRPLWELWVVEGIEGDRVAVLPKVSHVMADGIALLDFAVSVLDLEPNAQPDEPNTWKPAPPPSRAELIGGTWLERGRRLVGLAGGAALSLTRPLELARTGWELAGTTRTTLSAAADLPLTSPVGAHRDFVWRRLPLAELRAIEHEHGVTLNDVVLAVTAGALRRYVDRTDGRLDDRLARVLVPVSTHGGSGDEVTENRFSILIADLPTATDDPIERLDRMHTEMMARKGSAIARLTSLVFNASDLVPSWLLSTLASPILRRQHVVNLAVTNLPGSSEPLYFLDARLVELYPFVSNTGNVAVIIGVLSYTDGLGVGVTVDADVIDDADALADDFVDAAHELIEHARSPRYAS